jgi:hypothetical protein
MILDFNSFLYEDRAGAPLGNDNWDKAVKALWLLKEFKKLSFRGKFNKMAKEYSHYYNLDKYLEEIKSKNKEINKKEISELKNIGKDDLIDSFTIMNECYTELATNKNVKDAVKRSIKKKIGYKRFVSYIDKNMTTVYSHKRADEIREGLILKYLDFLYENSADNSIAPEDEEDETTTAENTPPEDTEAAKKADDEKNKKEEENESDTEIESYIKKLNKMKNRCLNSDDKGDDDETEDKDKNKDKAKDKEKISDDEESDKTQSIDNDEETNESAVILFEASSSTNSSSSQSAISIADWNKQAGIESLVKQRDEILLKMWKEVKQTVFYSEKKRRRLSPEDGITALDNLAAAMILDICEGGEETSHFMDWVTAGAIKLKPDLSTKWAKSRKKEQYEREWKTAKMKGAFKFDMKDVEEGKINVGKLDIKFIKKIPNDNEIWENLFKCTLRTTTKITLDGGNKLELPTVFYVRNFKKESALSANSKDKADTSFWYYKLTSSKDKASVAMPVYLNILNIGGSYYIPYIIANNTLYRYKRGIFTKETGEFNAYHKKLTDLNPADELKIEFNTIKSADTYDASNDNVLINPKEFKNWEDILSIANRSTSTTTTTI